MALRPLHFIGEPVQARYDAPPLLEKKPGPPDGFTWRGVEYQVVEVLSEWHDYQRRGRMSGNMQPQHAKVAASRGSWGVGQDYYRVRTGDGHIYDLYYDRAPKGSDQRKGAWFLDKELEEI